jgi:hypothetical protein
MLNVGNEVTFFLFMNSSRIHISQISYLKVKNKISAGDSQNFPFYINAGNFFFVVVVEHMN